jgi:tRNA pseudouridine38-40 synthase
MAAAPGEAHRFRLVLAYVGTAYGGWQRQPNAATVQEVVETALADLTGESVVLAGAGRTDAGVHARGQVAHFDLSRPFPAAALVHGTNHRLPPDIRVLEAAEAGAGFHARYSAAAKAYSYRFLPGRSATPEEAAFAVPVPELVDRAALRDATLHLPGRHDFAAFALAGGAHRTTVRSLYAARWSETAAGCVLHVVGEGFLRGMVRAIAGTLLEVGLGRRDVADFRALLSGAPRSAAGATAPAQGLTLERIWYPPAPAGGTRSAADGVIISNE